MQHETQQPEPSKPQSIPQKIEGPPAPLSLTKKSEPAPLPQKLIEPPQPQKRKKFPPKPPAPKQINAASQQLPQTVMPSGENNSQSVHSSADNVSSRPVDQDSSQSKVVVDGKDFLAVYYLFHCSVVCKILSSSSTNIYSSFVMMNFAYFVS